MNGLPSGRIVESREPTPAEPACQTSRAAGLQKAFAAPRNLNPESL